MGWFEAKHHIEQKFKKHDYITNMARTGHFSTISIDTSLPSVPGAHFTGYIKHTYFQEKRFRLIAFCTFLSCFIIFFCMFVLCMM